MSVKHNLEQWIAQLDYDDTCDISDRQVSDLIRDYAALEARCAALLDELDAKDKRLNEILTPNMLLPVIDEMDADNLRHVIKTASENYSLLHAKWVAAEKLVAEQRETLLAARSYVMQCARWGDAHSNGVLQAIDRAAAGKGEAS
ncbi:TPA: hypothetical protein ACOEGC_004663 [Enterobacter kobei]